MPRAWRIQRWFSAGILILFALGAILLTIDWSRSLPTTAKAEFVGRQSCISCHKDQAAKWTNSHHDRAMDHAKPDTVLGDFSGAEFKSKTNHAKFTRANDRFFIETIGASGKEERHEIKYTFGFEPLQQYLVEMPDGRLQALTIAWDTKEKRWFDLYPDQKIAPGDPLHWTGRGMNWQVMCAECHSTDVHTNFDTKKNTYSSTWKDIDVGCESCHGPGSLHVSIMNDHWLFNDRHHGTGLVALKNADSQVLIDTCGRCHVRGSQIQGGFQPGDSLLDHVKPEILDGPAYYADGQIRDEDFDYTSFHLSLMYHKGVRCTDCHDPHSAQLVAQGNALCCRCHDGKRFDTPKHHFHQTSGKGAQCVECHMPETTYMQVDPRRDHSFSIPRPDRTIGLGIPNACNRCHKDKEPAWSLEQVTKWYGNHGWQRRQDFAGMIAAGRDHLPVAEAGLSDILNDATVAAVVRASAASLLSNYSSSQTGRALDESIRDKSVLVRSESARAIGNQLIETDPYTGEQRLLPKRLDLLLECLTDESMAVRQAAAVSCLGLPAEAIPPKSQQAFEHAVSEYKAAQEAMLDRPASQLNLGNLALAQGNSAAAESHFQMALTLEPTNQNALMRLAVVYDLADRFDEALATLTKVINQAHRAAIDTAGDADYVHMQRQYETEARFQRALVLARRPERLADALQDLEKVTEVDPTRDRAWYNRGLAEQTLNKMTEAETSLRRAVELAPTIAEYRQALAMYYAKRGDISRAKQVVETILNRHPGNQAALRLKTALEK